MPPVEKPLTLCAELVTFVLSGFKTQTRRLKHKYCVGDILYISEPLEISMNSATYIADGVLACLVNGSFRLESEFMPPQCARPDRFRVIRTWEERVQDISDDDAYAEGCADYDCVWYSPLVAGAFYGPKEAFGATWDWIYGNQIGKRWEDNPIVYACEWEKVQ